VSCSWTSSDGHVWTPPNAERRSPDLIKGDLRVKENSNALRSAGVRDHIIVSRAEHANELVELRRLDCLERAILVGLYDDLAIELREDEDFRVDVLDDGRDELIVRSSPRANAPLRKAALCTLMEMLQVPRAYDVALLRTRRQHDAQNQSNNVVKCGGGAPGRS
jgi:hypothetical protein